MDRVSLCGGVAGYVRTRAFYFVFDGGDLN